MRYEVLLTKDAARDLEEIYDYIGEHDASGKAKLVLQQIERVLDRLATVPERGTHPKELVALGIREYRQVFFKPYRILYRVDRPRVHVLLIADGRRDMQTLLAWRLLGA